MLIRYPGSKAKIFRHINREMPPDGSDGLFAKPTPCYCEPFFGSGAIGLKLLPHLDAKNTRIVLSDIDPWLVALWRAVLDAPSELQAMVKAHRPNPDDFYAFKAQDGDPCIDPVLAGFRKLVLHQTSFSGLGAKAGGPLGGRRQRSEYNTGCRWNAKRLCLNIYSFHCRMIRFRRLDLVCGDFAAVLAQLPADAFAYLDPPYYVQGGSLYKYPFAETDHERLAVLLRVAPFRWLLSYDDHPRVRELYSWAEVGSFDMTPTTATARNGARRKNNELLIRPRTP